MGRKTRLDDAVREEIVGVDGDGTGSLKAEIDADGRGRVVRLGGERLDGRTG
jgi:hypothetical protein